MKIEITEELLSSVLAQIKEQPKRNASSLKGNPDANLLAIRSLRDRGLIKGVFLNDTARDQHGPLLYDAATLEAL
ncbi:hypothetical protein [Pseudomonas citronellolis]|uniref:hypothetical protein n=1 Tax=Pseudomonas citronellolis TaxID=53408 RepID=UPI0023E456E4|nr:hypothetical protein [Pseudomonas citronellolis]MDF3932126.1 hypothetical protein [Pseudomonas citronellolis]